MHVFTNELRRSINTGMLLAIIGVGFCICFDSWNDLMGSIKENNGILHYFFWNSAYGGVCRSYILPIFAAIPFACSFCNEYNENALAFIVAREGKTGYCIIKYIINALCGGLVVALGTALLFLFLSLIFPIVDVSIQDVTLTEPFHLWLAIHRPVLYGFVEIANGFLTGLLWSSVALFVSSYIPNMFVIIVSPYLASFILIHTFRLMQVDNLHRFDKWLTGYSIIGSSIQTLIYSFIVILIIISILGFLFTINVRRRIENELHR